MKIEFRLATRCVSRSPARCFARRDFDRHFVPLFNQLTDLGMIIRIWEVPSSMCFQMETQTDNDALAVRKLVEKTARSVNSKTEVIFHPKWFDDLEALAKKEPEWKIYQWVKH